MGIEKRITCTNTNKVGFTVYAAIDAHKKAIAETGAQVVAISGFASGALPPKKPLNWRMNHRGSIQARLLGLQK